jgi:hypothetical protein
MQYSNLITLYKGKKGQTEKFERILAVIQDINLTFTYPFFGAGLLVCN